MIRLGPMAESRLYKIAHCNLLKQKVALFALFKRAQCPMVRALPTCWAAP
jgi:hypothetical protein